MASCRRPEHLAPPEIFYGMDEARKYTTNSRMIEIQEQMSTRALELLALPDDRPALILDLGCGSGLSGEAIEEAGHQWIGFDISKAMLDIAVEREVGKTLPAFFPILDSYLLYSFLDAFSHLYKRVFPSVHRTCGIF